MHLYLERTGDQIGPASSSTTDKDCGVTKKSFCSGKTEWRSSGNVSASCRVGNREHYTQVYLFHNAYIFNIHVVGFLKLKAFHIAKKRFIFIPSVSERSQGHLMIGSSIHYSLSCHSIIWSLLRHKVWYFILSKFSEIHLTLRMWYKRRQILFFVQYLSSGQGVNTFYLTMCD